VKSAVSGGALSGPERANGNIRKTVPTRIAAAKAITINWAG
jgi:hypothetical protein